MKWKQIFAAAFAVTLLCAALCVSAGASDYDNAARDLSAIGMFRGTENGFELDRAPTRSEAAIMLVRLYGAEENAKSDYEAGKIAHPFTDVSAFTTPYVAYLYTNGLTKGTSATTFGSGSPCTLANYTVFLLRALGYQDGVDFQYANALNFAKEKSLETSDLNAEPFLRGHLAELTRRALGLGLKDGSATLLDSLISSGAIDAEAAAPLKIHRDGFSVPTGEAFALTGENAVLYTATAKYLYEKYDSVLSETGTLLIPAVTVYGKYAADNGGTHYVCGLSELWFYDLALTTNVNADSLRNEQVGSGGGPVRITLDRNGVCVNITEYPDGDTPEGRLRYIREICGSLTDLVEPVNNGTATGEKLTPDGWKEPFNAYLQYFYPQYYKSAEPAENDISVEKCLEQVTDIYDDSGRQMILTAADVVFAKVMRCQELQELPDFAYTWFPPERAETMVWAITVETTGHVGGLPHGGVLANVKASLVFDAMTGELLQSSYQGR